ncbi:hypothetical protein A9Q99_00180 [Gammaproteobacteria bacterium 45_16_T64]|nr:hypothetical protein A9Q99_00180 [Gammaproteobacteria bacterium 45_16_T64]
MESLTLSLSNGRFAIPLCRIDELLPMMTIRHIPDIPGFIYGGINLRGRLLPVIDLVTRLGAQWQSPPPPMNESEANQTHFTTRSRLIIVSQVQHRFAVIIDGVDRIEEFSAADTHNNVTVDGVHPDYLQGMVLENEEIIQLVLIDQLLTMQELSLLSTCDVLNKDATPDHDSENIQV